MRVLHALPLAIELSGLSGYPPYVVFLEALDEVDALEHVGDVVDASFLHVQDLHGLVEVEAVVFGLYESGYELFCQFHKTVFLPAPSAHVNVHEALVLELANYALHLPA